MFHFFHSPFFCESLTVGVAHLLLRYFGVCHISSCRCCVCNVLVVCYTEQRDSEPDYLHYQLWCQRCSTLHSFVSGKHGYQVSLAVFTHILISPDTGPDLV